jgi:hypothetical protein
VPDPEPGRHLDVQGPLVAFAQPLLHAGRDRANASLPMRCSSSTSGASERRMLAHSASAFGMSTPRMRSTWCACRESGARR